MRAGGLPARALRVLAYVVVLSVATGAGASARAGDEASGRVRGRVITPDGVAVPGAAVHLERDGAVLSGTVVYTAADGTFELTNVPVFPDLEIVVEEHGTSVKGVREPVAVGPNAVVEVTLVLALRISESVTVTDTGEERLMRETPASVQTLDSRTIGAVRPAHPGQLLGRVPGVWVNTTGGEGHMTAIRQPLTTNPVYLFLEDGVPTRSTGFFNHNALYEVNVPAAAAVEVTRGPGSALYGSDAIGGVVNVLTRSAFEKPGTTVDVEGGPWGWGRLLVGTGLRGERQALRADVNVTRTDGWRVGTAYDRESVSIRWDRVLGGSSSLKTLGSFSHIDQGTAGSSVLAEADYLEHPRINLTPISYRQVRAFRLSTEYQRASRTTLVSVLPYFRYNSMGLLPNWTLTFDPTEYTTANASFGLIARVRRDFTPLRTQLVAGVDVDVSPGDRLEHRILPEVTRDDGRRIFTGYTVDAAVYDYDVRFRGVSPYVHVEFSPTDRLRVSGGLRADLLSYDYHDHLDVPDTPRHRRPDAASPHYEHLSPKLGVTYAVNDSLSLFGAYRRGFRVPSEGQLFRQGTAANTIDLRPVKADNFEAGLRARPHRLVSFDLSAYQLEKRDDILTWRNPIDGATEVRNAGRTSHRGLELSADVRPHRLLQAHAAWTWARHHYESWTIDPAAGVSYDGNVMEAAPEHLGTVVLAVAPEKPLNASFEIVRVGEYWLDAENTEMYRGHTLLNVRAAWRVRPHVELFTRLLNATDARYAESSSFTQARGRELAPGMPRTLYGGLRLEWTR